MADDAAMLLVDARRKPGVDQRDDRDVEAVAEADEARRLVGRVDVQDAGQHFRLLRTTPTLRPSTRAKPQITLRAKWAWTSVNESASTMPAITRCMS